MPDHTRHFASVPSSIVYFPRTDNSPPEPAPFVMTESELIHFVRLDEAGTEHPERTIQRWRTEGKLRGSKVGNGYRYTIPQVLYLLECLEK